MGPAKFIGIYEKRSCLVWFYQKSRLSFMKVFYFEGFINLRYSRNFFSVRPIFREIRLVNFLSFKLISDSSKGSGRRTSSDRFYGVNGKGASNTSLNRKNIFAGGNCSRHIFTYSKASYLTHRWGLMI